MNKLTFLIAFLFFFEIDTFSQLCLPYGVTFTTQEQIDNFQNDYPGCTMIEGDVQITGNNITNLEGLELLISIRGNLSIYFTVTLTNLNGLNNLNSIDGGLYISDTELLINLNGLNNLNSIGEGIDFSYNYNLIDLSSLTNLTTINGGDIWIMENPNLTSLSGLEHIDPFSIDELAIEGNNSLSECSITSICNYLFVSENEFIPINNNGPGCNSIDEVIDSCADCPVSDIIFNSQSEIDNFISEFLFCDQVPGNVLIQGNDIIDLSGLTVLTSIGGNVDISNNPLLTNLIGLENINSIGGNLSIVNNAVLTSLSGLDNVDHETIIDLTVSNNPLLSDCAIYSICDYLSAPNGNVLIENNAADCNNQSEIEEACNLLPCFPQGIVFTTQEEIDNFQIDYPNCTEIVGDVLIEGNLISNLDGLNVLTGIYGDLQIINNPSLDSLAGLSNLLVLGGDLSVINNDHITSLSAFDNLEQGSILNLTISNNLILSSCNAIGICNFLAIPDGNVDIFSNYSGCNNIEQVTESCNICIIDIIQFWSQAQIDSFQVDYPNCSAITGHLYVSGDEITNLNGLSVLTSIGGGLSIGHYEYPPTLTSLAGLENLTTIGGRFSLVNLSELQDLSELTNLNFIGGLDIDNLSGLSNLTGLENLTHIGKSLEIRNCNSLVNLSGIENITSLYGLFIRYNNAIANLEGLQNVTSIDNFLIIWDNNNLINLEGLESLTSLGSLSISSNNALINLSNLENLISIGNVSLIGNGVLTSSYAFGNITSIEGNLRIVGNGSLTDFSDFYNINTIEGYLEISHLNYLNTNLIGFDNLTSIGKYFWIHSSDSLLSFNGLENLNSIGDGLYIYWNPNLVEISALINLTSFNGNVHLLSNNSLTSLSGLSNINYIDESLSIKDNSSLTDLSGLEGIVTVSDYVEISNNNSLISFSGLNNLISIGSLLIGNNPSLLSIDSLYNLNSLSTIGIRGNSSILSLSGLDNIDSYLINSLSITDNLSLFTCDVQSICDYIASPYSSIEISNNAPGCNTQSEVEAECLVGIVDIETISFFIYPNPTKGKVNITVSENVKVAKVRVYNVAGMVVIKPFNSAQGDIATSEIQLDVSRLVPGMYLLEVETKDGLREVKRLLIE